MVEPTILLFHPDPVEVRVLTGMLRSAGYRVVVAAGLRDARVILGAESIRVALLDGERDVDQTARILQEVEARRESIACVLLASSDRAWFVERALTGGRVVAVLPEPASASELLATVSLAMTDPDVLRPSHAASAPATGAHLPWTDSQAG